jgi:quercetin dioxygenase-like cupin family protein
MDERQKLAITDIVSDRTPRPLMAPVLNFDLAVEANVLREEAAWKAHGHNARTLVKHSEFRLVLITLREGMQIHEQQVAERISLQTLRGSLRVHIPTETLELSAGRLIALDRQLPFSIEALSDSEFLLLLGWSKH